MVYKTFIGILEGQLESVEKVCRDTKVSASNKGQKFEYEIVNSPLSKYKKLLMIVSSDKKDNERWAGWFIHKVISAKFPEYFWTKFECDVCGYEQLLKSKELIEVCPKCGAK